MNLYFTNVFTMEYSLRSLSVFDNFDIIHLIFSPANGPADVIDLLNLAKTCRYLHNIIMKKHKISLFRILFTCITEPIRIYREYSTTRCIGILCNACGTLTNVPSYIGLFNSQRNGIITNGACSFERNYTLLIRKSIDRSVYSAVTRARFCMVGDRDGMWHHGECSDIICRGRIELENFGIFDARQLNYYVRFMLSQPDIFRDAARYFAIFNGDAYILI